MPDGSNVGDHGEMPSGETLTKLGCGLLVAIFWGVGIMFLLEPDCFGCKVAGVILFQYP